MDGEIRGFQIVTRPLASPPVHVDTILLSRCDVDVSIPSQAKRDNRPSSHLEAGKTVLFLTCGTLSIPLDGGRASQETSGVS